MNALLSDIEAFLDQHRMRPTRFGADAIGDRHLVRTLRGGRELLPRTEQKVRSFMERYASTPTEQSA